MGDWKITWVGLGLLGAGCAAEVPVGSTTEDLSADANGDGVIGRADLEHVRDCLFLAPEGDCEGADLTGDGVVNVLDLNYWKMRQGDADLDGDVDYADYDRIRGCFGEVGPSAECRSADLFPDGVVDARDVAVWSAGFRRPVPLRRTDVNGDGRTDAEDLAIVSANLFRDPRAPSMLVRRSNVNGDRTINLLDLNLVKQALGGS